jgi:hypothetical protein
VGDWYAPYVLSELETIRRGIESAPADVQLLLFGAWSSTLVKVSWRRSDTSAQREEHRRPPGTAATLFHKKTRELARRLLALREQTTEGTLSPVVHSWDARDLGELDRVDLILTSPPYPAVYDYLPMQMLREAWMGIYGDRRAEIGARRLWRRSHPIAMGMWCEDTARWIGASARVMSSTGHLVVVIGDGLVGDQAIDTWSPTIAAAEQHGLRMEAGVSVARPDHARGSRRWEHAMMFRVGRHGVGVGG